MPRAIHRPLGETPAGRPRGAALAVRRGPRPAPGGAADRRGAEAPPGPLGRGDQPADGPQRDGGGRAAVPRGAETARAAARLFVRGTWTTTVSTPRNGASAWGRSSRRI